MNFLLMFCSFTPFAFSHILDAVSFPLTQSFLLLLFFSLNHKTFDWDIRTIVRAFKLENKFSSSFRNEQTHLSASHWNYTFIKSMFDLIF